jgi:ribosome-binding factor A
VSERMRRVNESLRKVLADGVERLGDPAVGFVTVTGVRATTDFSQAVVYVSVLGGEKRRARSLRALERAHGVLQDRIARELRLRRTPQLIFQYDETVDRALRMSELIDQVAPAPGTDEQVNEDSDDR